LNQISSQHIKGDVFGGLIAAVMVMTEALQILFGVLKQGRYITMKPYTVISGCMSGSGFILNILQIGPFPGQAIPKDGDWAISSQVSSAASRAPKPSWAWW
jgi:MFS superfamily sulfate permease-like transporter